MSQEKPDTSLGPKHEDHFFEDIVENLPGAMFHYWINGDGTDSVEFVNDGCQDIWEISAKEVKENASAMWEMVLPEDVEHLQKSVIESTTNLSKWDCQWRIKTPSGKLKWIHGIAKPRRMPDGGTYWNTMALDITQEKEAAQNIKESYTKTVEVLTAALEARDPYTAGHSRGVADIAVNIATEMGLSAEIIEGLALGALVHDIGKIKIPAEILTNPNELSHIEMDFIKQHPLTGADLLEKAPFEWPIRAMVLQHHERCDGSGYPNGLKADEIILEAKIIAVADTIESMATNRPYRFAPGIEKAMAVLRAGAGTQYDKTIVEVALKLYEGVTDLSKGEVN